MSKESESYRLQMLRRLQNRYSKGDPPEVLEAKKVIAKFSEQEKRDREAIARLGSPLPEPDLCPTCFYIHGRCTPLIAAHSPSPDNFDRMKCSVCDYAEDREAM
jgi:hypothetical protein